jgi:hypothetical protein
MYQTLVHADLDRKVMRLARNNAQARRFIEFSPRLRLLKSVPATIE